MLGSYCNNLERTKHQRPGSRQQAGVFASRDVRHRIQMNMKMVSVLQVPYSWKALHKMLGIFVPLNYFPFNVKFEFFFKKCIIISRQFHFRGFINTTLTVRIRKHITQPQTTQLTHPFQRVLHDEKPLDGLIRGLGLCGNLLRRRGRL